jgi:plasmid replication initiation protein
MLLLKMEIKKYNENNYLVKQSNELVEHCQMNFTKMEYAVISAALSQVHKDHELTDQVTYEIPISGFNDLLGRHQSGELYKTVLAASINAVGKKVKIKTNPDGTLRDKALHTVILQSAQYAEDGSHTIQVRFGTDAVPYLSGKNVEDKFTLFSVRDGVMNLSSVYSIRLYHLISRWGAAGATYALDLDEFRWMMNCEDKYPKFAMFKKNVIDMAIREINDKTNFKIDVGYGKRGRRYASVQFDIKKKKPKKVEIEKLEWEPWFKKYKMARAYSPHSSETVYESQQRTFGDYNAYKKDPLAWVEKWEQPELDNLKLTKTKR